MYLFDLEHKLKRLNPKLYVKGGGLYLRANQQSKRRLSDADLHYDVEGSRRLRDYYSGQRDLFLEATSKDYMPEYDEFDLELGTMTRKGWRTLVWSLVKRGLCTADKARTVFTASLGEHTYDKLTFDERLSWARRSS